MLRSAGPDAAAARWRHGLPLVLYCSRRAAARDPVSVKKRAEMRIPKLKAMLESEASLRLKPALYGKMERRSRMEAALREAEFRVAQSGIRKAKARAERIEDPCDEADFKPPRRPWPRLKSKSR
jgi:hypothetical protein